VVAEAVKDLAQKVEQSSKQIAGTVQQLDARIKELALNIRESKQVNGQETFSLAFGRVEEAVSRIASAAEQNVQACSSTQQSVESMSGQVREQGVALEQAKNRALHFLTSSEHLIELSADCGAETGDTPYIRKVREVAAAIGARFEQAVASGEIVLADLFDENYAKVAGTNPQQLRTRFVEFTDRVLPAFQEPLLEFSNKVVFCAAVDRNGYLPTHNLKFSKPQGTDPVWNAANCRNRRLFNDRTGLAAGRNTRKFLLQTYRRDMGGGRFVLMKDLSAPIMVNGRHWGGLRFAYQF
jgi:methyl-accepting chemotaxis protein